MTGWNDYTGNYSIGIDNFDGSFYIFMNISKTMKELTGLQYDYGHNCYKSIEWNKQTEKIKDSLIQHYEIDLGGEWLYTYFKVDEVIKNIKIKSLHRDRIKGEIHFTYNYTEKDYKGIENNWYSSVTGKKGKITNCWSSDKFSSMALYALNEEILNRIIQLSPAFDFMLVNYEMEES